MYGDEMKVDTMLHGVNVGDVCTTHRESITDSIHILPINSPLSACLPVIDTLLPANELCILSFCSSMTDVQNVLLEHSVCLPVTMRLG